MSAHPQQLRAVLRKAAAPKASAHVAPTQAQTDKALEGEAHAEEGFQTVEPYCLLDAVSWQMCPQAVVPLLSSNPDFTVVAALGPQGLGKSSFLNRLLGLGGTLLAAGPHPTPAFPTAAAMATAAQAAGRHCTRGIELRVGAERILTLDTQPLFSASVLEEMLTSWEQPPPALAVPAVAAAGDAKAATVPYEGVAALAQLQLAVLLLSACHRVLVFCDGLHDRQTWELLLTAEMLARGIPDPSLPPRDPPAAATGAAGQPPQPSQQQQRQQLPPQEHLAEVILVHVVKDSRRSTQMYQQGAGPSMAELQLLEQQLDAFFASSRLRRPGALRMLEKVSGSSSGGGGGASSTGNIGGGAMSYWVLPALPAQDSEAGADAGPSSSSSMWAAEDAWAALVAQLLARPCPPFAQRCSERQWLRGLAGDTWRAVRKSADIATFYSRLARTQLKGAGGWGLAR